MIGYVEWKGGRCRGELADDARTLAVTVDGLADPRLSECYTRLVAPSYGGPSDGDPGRVRLLALAKLTGGEATFVGPEPRGDAGVME